MSLIITQDQSLDLEVKLEKYEIVKDNDPILEEKMNHFYFTQIDNDPHEISRNLIHTMIQEDLYGLAANQCGLKYNVLVFGADDNYYTMFNPEIMKYSENEVMLEEGCCNYMGLVINIKRPKSIVIKFQDKNGTEYMEMFTGFSARILQQCVDSLNGIVYIDRAKPLAIERAKKKRKKSYSKFIRERVKKVKA